jgi:hypothetical protein
VSTLLSQPDEYANLYEGLVYQFENKSTISNYADNGGNLQVRVTGDIGDLINVNDFVFASDLVDVADISSPNVQVTAKAANASDWDLTLNTSYDAGYSGGYIRALVEGEFTIRTGFDTAAQPQLISGVIKVTPNPQGILEFDVQDYVRSRFITRGPQFPILQSDTLNSYDNVVKYWVQETGESAQSARYARKSVEGSGQYYGVFYSNFKQPVSQFSNTYYKNRLIYTGDTAYESGDTINLLLFKGQSFTLTFDDTLQDGSLTTTPAKPSWWGYIGDTVLTGITGAPTETGIFSYTIDDGSFDYTLNIEVIEPLEAKEYCSGVMVAWWHRQGGWQFFSFEGQIVEGLSKPKTTTVRQNDNEYLTSIEEVRDTLALNTKTASKEVLRHLKSLSLATQIYKVNLTEANGIYSVDSYERYYLDPSSRSVLALPFQASENGYTLELVKSQELKTTNES